MASAKKIERLSKGDKNRTAKHAAVMNEIIDALNTLLAMTVVSDTTADKPNAGDFIYSDGNVVLKLKNPGGGTIDVAGGNTLDQADDGEHEVDEVKRITFVGYGDPTPVEDNGDGEVVVRILPDPVSQGLDTSKKYALVFVYEDGIWQLEPLEICSS
jgi:hypothetical protein